jgi:hypothetical protein
MIEWGAWGLMLLLQNASFTWVSRARNSRSLSYHAVASVCSNGVWFLNLGVAVNKINDAWASESMSLIVMTTLFYTVFTVVGSVGMHHVLMTKVERGHPTRGVS